MSKTKSPVFSLDARGALSKAISFVKRRGVNIAEKTPIPKDAKTSHQLSWRTMYQLAVELWHALSAAEKLAWESSARPRHMTGFAWFMSQALRPNPGLYLPLLGGAMQGDIDIATFRLLNLPAPALAHEPLRLSEYTANIAPFLYHEGARVYHNANQAIPDNTNTTLSFNTEIYDTDTIHDLIINNSRLTCKTAGKYMIAFECRFASNAAGFRMAVIILNGLTNIAAITKVPDPVAGIYLNLSTIYALAVTDYVTVFVYQNSGGALNVTTNIRVSPEFMMQRIGA